jgi:hypothetical protein
MLANTKLSNEGLFGESTAILDRSIFETSLKLRWLCDSNTQANFDRYVADGLKVELELKLRINEAIAARGGEALAIERRMIQSVDRYIATSGQSEVQIRDSASLPNLADILAGLGEQTRMMYVIGQRIGSHHVHGTWPGLLAHYLSESDDGYYRPQNQPSPTHPQQYSYCCMFVLTGLLAFLNHVIADREEFQTLLAFVGVVQAEIQTWATIDDGDAFDAIPLND